MNPAFKATAIPAYNWTGFYVGVNAGYGVGRNPTTVVDALFVSNETISLQPAGRLGGLQAGYNWQVAPTWVVGLEADIQATGQSQTICVVRCISSDAAEIIEQTMPWFGTLRGRVGWTNGPTLIYATGGLAYGSEKTTATIIVSPNPAQSYSFTHNRAGWTAGGGIEAAVAPNWTAKAEYLYIDLGSATDVMPFGGFLTFSNTQSFRDNVFRLGLNYHPGTAEQAYASAVTPVPVAPYSWDGFYVGVNTGYGAARNPSSYVVTGFEPESESFSLDPAGWLGGAQFGFNHQFGQWVLGAETDIQAQAVRNSPTCILFCTTTTMAQISQSLPWFGTLRGRAGWANGPALFYATGGLAYGKVETAVNAQYTTFGAPAENALNLSSTHAGWAAGAGVEGHIAGNWTAKAEYLYIALSGQSGSFFTNLGGGRNNTTTFTTDLREHIFRVGLNYKIN